MQMVDYATELSIAPDAGIKPPIAGTLLQPCGNEVVQVWGGPNEINPRMPQSQVISVGIDDVEKFAAVRMLNQLQFHLHIYFLGKDGTLAGY